MAFISSNLSVGYAPANRMTLVLHRQSGRQENSLGQNIRDSKAAAVSLGYQF